MRPRRTPTSAVENFPRVRADYDAAKQTRFTRKRTSLGGSGDTHYRHESEFLRLIETVRDMERNGWFVERALTLATRLEVGEEGPTLNPRTGDEGLDRELAEGWRDYSQDPRQFDAQERFTFAGQCEQVSRAVKRDGDIVGNLSDDGHVELLEADRLRTPVNTRRRVVHGVLQDDDRRPLEYWIGKDPGMQRVRRVGDVDRLARYDELGTLRTLHPHDPRRVTQTRGVTAFAPIIERSGMAGDLEFAHLVQAQMVAAFAMYRKKGQQSGDWQVGSRETNTRDDGTDQILEGISPGMLLTLEQGEELGGFSPDIPNPEFFRHIRLVLQQMSVTLYLPLVMLMMDASETNFSGYRAAVQQARDNAKRNRKRILEAQYCRPVYHWYVQRRIRDEPAIRDAARKEGVKPLRHDWKWPHWRSIQPKDDAQANALRLATHQASSREIAAEEGRDHEDRLAEIIEDNTATIRAAADAAERINNERGLGLSWRDVLYLHADANKLAGQLVSNGSSADAGDSENGNAVSE